MIRVHNRSLINRIIPRLQLTNLLDAAVVERVDQVNLLPVVMLSQEYSVWKAVFSSSALAETPDFAQLGKITHFLRQVKLDYTLSLQKHNSSKVRILDYECPISVWYCD